MTEMNWMLIGGIIIVGYFVLIGNPLVEESDADAQAVVGTCYVEDVTIEFIDAGYYGISYEDGYELAYMEEREKITGIPYSTVTIYDGEGQNVINEVQVACQDPFRVSRLPVKKTPQEIVIQTNVLEDTGVFDLGGLLT